VTGALIGAAAGAAVAFFYATDRGADRRADLARIVDRASVDLDEARRLWGRLREAWAELEQPATRSRHDHVRSWPSSAS
jgi:hypothetical protein